MPVRTGCAKLSVLSLLSPEKVINECKNHANNDTGSNREVETEILSLDENVAGQLSKKGDFWAKDHQNADGCYGKACDDKKLPGVR